jgi:capsule polysaccharide export protein KpsE/RkpR
MPLSEAEREVLARDAHGGQLPKPTHWLGWTEAFYRLWLRRARIGRWVVLGFALSLIVAWRYPKFESTVQIMPPEGSPSALSGLLPALTKSPGLTSLATDLMGAKTTGALFIKVLESRTVQDDLIRKFDLQKRYRLDYWDETRRKLDSRTSITEDKKSGVIALTVRDRDPRLAMDLANGYVEELGLVMGKVSTSAARQERIFIEQRLAEETKNLQQAEQQFSQFASANMALNVPEQMKVTVEAAARLQGELIATRAQIEGLKQTYTDENIRVKSAQAHLHELERALAKINSGQSAASGFQDSSNPYPSVKNLPLLGVQWTDLYRNSKIRETVVEFLTQQYEMARIQEAKENVAVKVLDSASTPEHKYPNWVLLTVAGTFLFSILACMGYLWKDRWDRWDRDDPRRMLIVQVLESGPGRIISGRGIFRRRVAKPDQMSQL